MDQTTSYAVTQLLCPIPETFRWSRPCLIAVCRYLIQNLAMIQGDDSNLHISISRMYSARWGKQRIYQQNFNRKSISSKLRILSPSSIEPVVLTTV